MIEVKKEKDFVCVTVELQKRIKATEPKIYIYTNDVLQEAKKEVQDVEFSQIPEKQYVVSNVRSPHKATWKFKIKEKSKSDKESVAEKKDLNFLQKRAKVESVVELPQEDTTSEE